MCQICQMVPDGWTFADVPRPRRDGGTIGLEKVYALRLGLFSSPFSEDAETEEVESTGDEGNER